MKTLSSQSFSLPGLASLKPAIFVALTTLLLDLIHFPSLASAKKGCSFHHDGCSYNIQLFHKEDAASIEEVKGRNCGDFVRNVMLDRAQNDYSAKIDDMEKNYLFLRDAHEQRLKELEGTVREMIGLNRPVINRSGRYNRGEAAEITKQLSAQMVGNNEEFMRKIEEEFDVLRNELRDKSTELMDTKLKLNETHGQIHELQLSKFRTSQDLLNTENQVTMLKRERAVLKNQLKDRSYKLDVSTQKATECEQKSTDQQDRILELFRSESTLKEELMTTQLKLNNSRKEQELLSEKHSSLKTRHERIKTIMRIREKELIDCYAAKTSTFCGFEDPKLCGFTNINDTSDFFDWDRAKGRTPSGRTGPSKDHTCGGPTGHFMYIEASAKGRGSNAILYSPLYRGMNEQCVEFFYHMYGRHVGTLNVYAQARGDVLQSAWRAYGNQGDVWTNAMLAIPKELAMAGYQLAFEGITENGYQGDISIDDVSVTDGPCPVDEKTVPVKVAVNSTSIIREGKVFARKLKKKLRRRSKAKSRPGRDNS